MVLFTRNAWSIVAYTWRGDVFCLECAARGLMESDLVGGSDRPSPVFASDECVHPCGTCGGALQ
jgi:hypothetical protein